jgi:hypothetical protein
MLTAQIKELEAEGELLLQISNDTAVEALRQLMLLRGIGVNSAWSYVMDFFSWFAGFLWRKTKTNKS